MPTDPRVIDAFAHELAAMFGQRCRLRRSGQPSPDPNSPDFDPHLLTQAAESSVSDSVDVAQLAGDASQSNPPTTAEVPEKMGVATEGDRPADSKVDENKPNMGEFGPISSDFLNFEGRRDDVNANLPISSPPNPPGQADEYGSCDAPSPCAVSRLRVDRNDSTDRSPDGPIAAGHPKKRRSPAKADPPKLPQGGQPIIELWYEPLTDSMADGTPMRKAATKIGMRLTGYECKQLQKRKALRAMYQRKRRAHSERKFARLQKECLDRLMTQESPVVADLKRELGLPEDY